MMSASKSWLGPDPSKVNRTTVLRSGKRSPEEGASERPVSPDTAVDQLPTPAPMLAELEGDRASSDRLDPDLGDIRDDLGLPSGGRVTEGPDGSVVGVAGVVGKGAGGLVAGGSGCAVGEVGPVVGDEMTLDCRGGAGARGAGLVVVDDRGRRRWGWDLGCQGLVDVERDARVQAVGVGVALTSGTMPARRGSGSSTDDASYSSERSPSSQTGSLRVARTGSSACRPGRGPPAEPARRGPGAATHRSCGWWSWFPTVSGVIQCVRRSTPRRRTAEDIAVALYLGRYRMLDVEDSRRRGVVGHRRRRRAARGGDLRSHRPWCCCTRRSAGRGRARARAAAAVADLLGLWAVSNRRSLHEHWVDTPRGYRSPCP